MLRGGTAAAIGLSLGAGGIAEAAPVVKAKSKSKMAPGRPAKAAARTSKSVGPAGAPSPIISPVSAQALSNEERALATAIAASVKHAIASAAARPPDTKFARGGYASIAQTYVKSLPELARRGALASARKVMRAPLPRRRSLFGTLATHNADVHRRRLRPVRPTIAKAAQEQAIRRVVKLVPAEYPGKGLKIIPAKYRRVGFFLNEIKCREETDEIGADHIKLAGAAISPMGVIVQIKPFTVSRDFDRGETVAYYPPGHGEFRGNDPFRGRPLARFALSSPHPPAAGLATISTPPSSFPCGFGLFLCMAEVDDGGFAGLVSQLWAAIGAEVKASLETITSTFAGMFGPLIAELIASIIRDVIGFIVNLFDNEDDWVDGLNGNLTLPTANKSYFAGLSGREPNTPDSIWASQRQLWRFNGDGGRYHAKMHWRVG